MKLALYQSNRDNAPTTGDLEWPALVAALSTHTRGPCTLESCPGKECPHKFGRAWSPVDIEGTRSNANVRAITSAVFDLDSIADEAWLAALIKQGVQGFIHSSHTHRADASRLRLVLALSRPVTPREWPVLWRAMIKAWGLPADEACGDVSRIYFAPSAPIGAPVVAASLPGTHPVDVDVLLAREPQLPAPILEHAGTSLATVVPSFGPATPAVMGEVFKRLEALGPAIEGKGGDAHTYQAASMVVRDFGLSPDEALMALTVWDAGNSPPWGEIGLREKIANAGAYAQGEHGRARRALEMRSGVAGALGPLLASAGVAPPLVQAANLDGTTPGLRAVLSELASRERPPMRTYPTVWRQLNALIGGGLKTRTLLVTLGPPGAGKTAWAVSVSLHCAMQNGVPVLYVSTELESEEISARHAAHLLACAWTAIEYGISPTAAEVQRALEGLKIEAIGAEVLPRGDAWFEALVREIHTMTLEHGVPPIVIVDYMQDLARGGKEENVRGRMGEIATNLRAISQVMDCVVVAISSVSRSWYGPAKAETMRASDDASIYLAAAKESGDVDYAAATVLFLDVDTQGDEESRPARIAVAKARRGRTGFAGGRFYGAVGRWDEDPAALVTMSPEMRKQSQTDRAASEIETKILEFVRANNGAYNKTSIVAVARINRNVGFDAIDRLLALGKLRCLGDERGGKIGLPGAPAPMVSDPALAKFTPKE